MPYYCHSKFGCNWTTNKGEMGGGGGTMVPKDPNLNRVNIIIMIMIMTNTLGNVFSCFYTC